MSEKNKTVTLVISDAKKLQTYKGRTVALPGLGEVTFSDSGTVECPENLVDAVILDTAPTFNLQVKGSPEQELQAKLSEEHQKIWDQLEGFKLAALVELADEAGIPKERLLGMSDSKIRKEIFTKLIESEKKELKEPVVEPVKSKGNEKPDQVRKTTREEDLKKDGDLAGSTIEDKEEDQLKEGEE